MVDRINDMQASEILEGIRERLRTKVILLKNSSQPKSRIACHLIHKELYEEAEKLMDLALQTSGD